MFSLSIAEAAPFAKSGHGLDDDHVLRIVHTRDALPEDQVQLGGEGMLRRQARSHSGKAPFGPSSLMMRSCLMSREMVACVVEKPASFSSASSCSLRLDAVVCDKLQNFFLAF